MAKRSATTDLNHENWDKEEVPEDSGTFAKASADVIKNRVIKVAKRRNPTHTTSSSNDGNNSLFGGFAFTKTTPTNTNMNSPFGFLSKMTNSNSDSKSSSEKLNINPTQNYLAKLKGLNESFLEWIKKHVETNALINLTPVFKDYEKHFNELQKMRENEPNDTDSKSTTTSTSLQETNTPNTTSNISQTSTLTMSFGSNLSSNQSSGFIFQIPNKLNTSNNNFSFSNVSNNNNSTSINKKVDVEKNDDEDEPPKNDFKPVIEEDHIYTIRCKVFAKKDGNFVERGVGNLFLKPIPDNEKVQLIVRAETNIGNLICNFILSKSLPLKRVGTKDVMLICLPTPDEKPPPITILIRVKTSQDADDLFNVLEKHQK